LTPSEKSFSVTLHDAEVKVLCHDALFMAQLQTEIAQKYGTESPGININDPGFFFVV